MENYRKIGYMNLGSSILHIYRLSVHSKLIADFKDYEDPSDEFRDKEGTLLPLWKFSYGKFKSMEVTGLCWNSAYQDLFVATLGSCQYI